MQETEFPKPVDFQSFENPDETKTVATEPNLIAKHPVAIPGDERPNSPRTVLVLPSTTMEDRNDVLRAIPEASKLDPEFESAVIREIDTRVVAGVLDPAAERETGKWTQSVESSSGALCAKKTSFELPDGEVISGDVALQRMNQIVNGASYVKIPLWHSGFWVTLRRPMEAELIAMFEQIAASKINLGRSTSGAVFSNTSVYLADAVLDLFDQCLHSTSLKSRENLRGKILQHDIQTIAWALALAVYPDGFKYTRPVYSSVPEKRVTIEEHLNLGKICWVDSNRLTAKQVAHMAKNGNAAMTDESLLAYHAEFEHMVERRYELAENYHVVFKVPTISDYLTTGNEWVESVIQRTNEVLLDDTPEADRMRMVTRLTRASTLRQFQHWVAEFHVGDRKVVDSKTIASFLEGMATNDVVRNKFFEHIADYIQDTTTSMIGVLTVNEEEDAEAHPRFPMLLPIDCMNTFFILLAQIVNQIEAR